MKDKQQQTNQSENTLTEIFKYEVEAGDVYKRQSICYG